MKRYLPAFASACYILLTLMTSSCATIFNGSKQKVMITSNPAGAEVYLNGKNTGKVTPCEIKIHRKVKATAEHRANEQHYVLKKEGYHDYEIKDRRSFSTGGTIGNSAAAVTGAIFMATAIAETAQQTPDMDVVEGGFSLAAPLLLFFPIDFLTGAIYTYDKTISANLIKKDREIVYLKTDSTVFTPDNSATKLANVYAVIVGVSDYKDKKNESEIRG